MAMQAISKTEATSEMTITESALMTSFPFFAHVLFNMLTVIPTEDPAIPTAGTDGKRMWVNIHFFASLSQPERVFLYCHEIYHAILLHMARGKSYMLSGAGPDGFAWDPKRWNWAADYVINDALIQDKIGVMPKMGLHAPNKYTHNDLVDDVYIKLRDDEEDGGGGEDGEGEPGDGPRTKGDGKGGEGFDEHIYSEADSSDNATAEMEIAVKQALSDAKSRGKVPGALRDMIEGLLNPQVDWSSYLLQEISTAVARAMSDWSRPNRRKLVSRPSFIMPTSKSTSCGTIVITIDTSGSISNHEAIMFLTEVYAIVTDYIPEELYILWIDAQVAHVDYLDDMSEIEDIIERCANEPLPGGGGTDMTKTFDYIEEWGIEPNTCIIFTDGYTPFGSEQDYPVVWGVSEESMVEKPDHGKAIYVKIPDA